MLVSILRCPGHSNGIGRFGKDCGAYARSQCLFLTFQSVETGVNVLETKKKPVKKGMCVCVCMFLNATSHNCRTEKSTFHRFETRNGLFLNSSIKKNDAALAANTCKRTWIRAHVPRVQTTAAQFRYAAVDVANGGTQRRTPS